MDKHFPEDISRLPVRLYKLINGENIIAYTHEVDDESNGALIHIEEPMKVITEGSDSFVLTPWIPFAATTQHILNDHDVLLKTDIQDDIKSHYMKIILDEIQHDQDILIEQTKIMKGNATTH